ncbi:MAG TPA: RDD family protein [Candidatus Limnocylindria bacterium]
MTEQPAPSWQPPERAPGPAPGVEFADFGPRLVAYIVDGLLVGAVVVVAYLGWALISLVTGGIANDRIGVGSAIWLAVLTIGVVAIGLGYFPYFWARDGATPGMKMMGLRVVRDLDGGPISTGQAILRLVGYWVSGLVFYLGYIWILIDKRRRGWHDLMAGTVVIKAP